MNALGDLQTLVLIISHHGEKQTFSLASGAETGKDCSACTLENQEALDRCLIIVLAIYCWLLRSCNHTFCTLSRCGERRYNESY